MAAAQGILTVRGGMTSHAAVVARGMGTCCVSGCGEIKMHEDDKYFDPGRQGPTTRATGSPSTAPPATSTASAVPTVEATISGDFGRFMDWADSFRSSAASAPTPITPATPRRPCKFGAEGIGLCRTEHMFFEGDRIKAMREMIVAKTVEARKEALAKILPYQQGDFEAMYRELRGPSDDHPLPGSAAARVPAHRRKRTSPRSPRSCTSASPSSRTSSPLCMSSTR